MESRQNRMVIGKNITEYLINFCFDTIFPIECLGCQKEGKWLCEDCFRKIKKTQKNLFCPICEGQSDFGKICKLCKKDFFLDKVFSAGLYNDDFLLQKAIHYFKYRYVLGLSECLSSFLIDYLKDVDFIPENSVIIPVPLHKKRFCQRGFNQSHLLANKISKSFKIEVLNNNLIRHKYTKAQVGLDERNRSFNVKGAFRLKRKDLILDKNIILVDDVFTTGATLNECAKVLKDAGAKEVWAVTLARG